jgi:hypothetical protein
MLTKDRDVVINEKDLIALFEKKINNENKKI